MFIKQSVTAPVNHEYVVDVNLYPFTLDEAEKAELIRLLDISLGSTMNINLINVSMDDLTVDLGFYFTGPIGSTLHDLYQSVLGLTNQQYTEKLITFNTFSPLSIRSRSDGIDLRDPNNIILYEFKTKESIPKEPYQEELLQNLFSVFLFRIEHRIDIRGSSMVYINRNDPYDVKFFNYDLFDESSSSYLDSKELLSPLIKKVQEILVAMRDHKAPSMDSEYIKKFAYGKPACPTCLYREHCQNEA